MSLNDTPAANRIHIGFFGRRNAGKSSLVNAVTGQDLAVVSETRGTTTDPVVKTMELLPLGPVVIIDTPGFDDEGALGTLRVRKTRQILNKTDLAVLVVDAVEGQQGADKELVSLFVQKNIPYVLVYNKSDLLKKIPETAPNEIFVSALKNQNIWELKERLGKFAPKQSDIRLIGDFIGKDDLVILVTPIDESAPKGRMILPQQQAIRDVLDADATAIVVKETQLQMLLSQLKKKPTLVVTDSQVFDVVDKIVPREICLTSFSILMARYKGYLETAVAGVAALDRLHDGDTILMAEGCTHHRQCNDIGTVKIPNWLRRHSGKQLNIVTCSGTEFPEDLSPYAVVIHCGGCMINDREIQYRMNCATDQQIPFTNYGITIAQMRGILDRSLEIIHRKNDAVSQ